MSCKYRLINNNGAFISSLMLLVCSGTHLCHSYCVIKCNQLLSNSSVLCCRYIVYWFNKCGECNALRFESVTWSTSKNIECHLVLTWLVFVRWMWAHAYLPTFTHITNGIVSTVTPNSRTASMENKTLFTPMWRMLTCYILKQGCTINIPTFNAHLSLPDRTAITEIVVLSL